MIFPRIDAFPILMLLALLITLTLIPVQASTMSSISPDQYAISRILIESIEDYSSTSYNDLPRSHDATQSFMNKLSGIGISFSWYKDDMAWQEDWWTASANGYDYTSYFNTAIFIGRGHYGGLIYFDRYANRYGRPNTLYVDFTGWVSGRNDAEVHPSWRIKWILLVSCESLEG